MPVPPGKEDLYGKVVGHMLNMGKSHEEAKAIADRAVEIAKKYRPKYPSQQPQQKGISSGAVMPGTITAES